MNIFYERLGRRSLFINKGLLCLSPIFCLMLFMLRVYNISAPPSINLLSEIFLIVRLLGYDKLIILVFPLGSFLGAVFTFYMYSYRQHGKGYRVSIGVTDNYFIELHILISHLFPVRFLLVIPNLFLLYI